MEQMDSITEHSSWDKTYRSVAAVCAIYLDAQTVETHLLKLTSFCINIPIIVLFRVLILVKLTFRTAVAAHQVIISIRIDGLIVVCDVCLFAISELS